MRQVICVVGPMCSGKSTFAKYLAERYGFTLHKLSDRIVEYCDRFGTAKDRENLQKTGDILRLDRGCDVLAAWTSELFEEDENIVVESIRHPAEVRFFKEAFKAQVVAITAPRSKRFKYLTKRGREGDPTDYKVFEEQDIREHSPAFAHSINVPGCLTFADSGRIQNNGPLSQFESNISSLTFRMVIEGRKPVSKERFFS